MKSNFIFCAFLSISLLSCASLDESISISSEKIITDKDCIIANIIINDQDFAKNYFGNKIYDYDRTMSHYQFSYSTNNPAFGDRVDVKGNYFPYIDYSFIKEAPKINILDSNNDATPLNISSNCFVFDIEDSPKINTISLAIANVLDYVPYASSIIRHNNDTYLYKRKVFMLDEGEDNADPYLEKTTSPLKNSYFEKLPSNDFVFPNSLQFINISYVDKINDYGSAGVCHISPSSAFYPINNSSFSMIKTNFDFSIDILNKYKNGDLYSKEKETSFFGLITEDKIVEDFDHSYLVGIVEHEFCHVLGLADLYTRENYNQDRTIIDRGESLMYGLTNYGKQTLKERDIDNLTSIYDGTFYQALLNNRNKVEGGSTIKLNF